MDDDISVPYRTMGLDGSIIDELWSLGQGKSLIEQFDSITVEHPDNYRLHRNFGYLLFKMKRYEEGLRELENYLSVMDKALVSDYQWVGSLCRKAGMIDKEIEFYETARDTEVTNQEVRRESMTCQMVVSDEHWKARVKARILETLGNLYMKKNRLTDAEVCFKEIVDLQSGRSKEKAQVNLAKIWKRMGKENVFVEELKSKVANDPCDAELRGKYGQTLLRAGKLDEAVEQFEWAVELSGGDLSVRLKLAEALAEYKQNQKAVAEYENVLYAALSRGKDQFRRGKGGDETEPWRVLRRLAEFCKRVGEKDKLLKIYDQVLESMDSPETKWKPDEYRLKRILRDMTEILAAKGEYDSIVELWLDYHRGMGYYAKSVIEEKIRYMAQPQRLVKDFRKEVESDPNNHWGRLILGELLVASNRENEALEVYTKLLADASSGPICYELERAFVRIGQNDLASLADKKGRRDNKSSKPTQPTQNAGPVENMVSIRTRAKKILSEKKNYAEAVKLYKQILEKAPTDVESMVYMGRAYEKIGNGQEALFWYEKAYSMRNWSGGKEYGAASNLERIYSRTGAEEKLINLLTERHDYSGIRGYHIKRKQPEKIEQYLLGQIEKQPNTQLQFYLGIHYLDNGNLTAAIPIYEQLRKNLIDVDGKVINKSNALNLARGFERLGRFDEALTILASLDYKNDRDSNDWLGELLMRLYSKTGEFEKSLDICVLRIKKHGDNEYRMKNIGKQIAKYSQSYNGEAGFLEAFLEKVKDKMSERHYRQFRGVVKTSLATRRKADNRPN